MITNDSHLKPETPIVGSIKTGMSFEFAYSRLARHISAARCWQEGLDDASLSRRQKSLLKEIREAYEFIQLFEQMMTTVQVEISNSIATSNQTIATEDFRRMFPRPVSAKENFDVNGETK